MTAGTAPMMNIAALRMRARVLLKLADQSDYSYALVWEIPTASEEVSQRIQRRSFRSLEYHGTATPLFANAQSGAAKSAALPSRSCHARSYSARAGPQRARPFSAPNLEE